MLIVSTILDHIPAVVGLVTKELALNVNVSGHKFQQWKLDNVATVKNPLQLQLAGILHVLSFTPPFPCIACKLHLYPIVLTYPLPPPPPPKQCCGLFGLVGRRRGGEGGCVDWVVVNSILSFNINRSSKDVMVRLYKAYVLPHLEYCSPLFLGVGNVEASKMESTNYYILRSILGYSKTMSYDTLLRLADIKSLEQRREFQSLVLLYKCLYNQGAPYISEFFNFKNVPYNWGLAQGWNSLFSIWNGCIDPSHFWPANCGTRCPRQ